MTKDKLIEFLHDAAKEYLIHKECPADSNRIDECDLDCINCWDDFIKNRYKNFKLKNNTQCQV